MRNHEGRLLIAIEVSPERENRTAIVDKPMLVPDELSASGRSDGHLNTSYSH